MAINRNSGLNGRLPTQYVPGWEAFNDLSTLQIAAFQAFPQDLVRYIGIKRWQTEISVQSGYITLPSGVGNISGMQLLTDQTSQSKIAALKQAIDNGAVTIGVGGFPFLAVNGVFMLSAADCTALYGYVVRYVQSTYAVAATLLAKVNATPQQLSVRSEIDAAFAAIVVT